MKDGGRVDEIEAADGGAVVVSKGGILYICSVQNGGDASILNGGTATGIKEAGGWVETGNAASVSFAANTVQSLSLENDSATVRSGTTSVDCMIGALLSG